MQEIDEGMSILPSSILLSLVATFDSIVGDFTREVLTLDPSKLESSNQTMTYREIFSLEDLDSTRRKLIEEEVGNLLRGSHQKQAEYLESMIETKIIDHYERWPNFIEVFERRNAYAHTGGLASSTYISKIEAAKYKHESKVGDTLRLSTSYLHKSVDVLTEFLTVLSFVTWRKLGGEVDDAFRALSDAAYAHITKKRYLLAVKLLDFALHKQGRKGAADRTIRQMHINLANAYKKRDDIDSMKRTLDSQDWSAASIEFNICLASLNDDPAEVARLLPNAAAAGGLDSDALRNWPVFDWVREDEAVGEAFEKVFGEKLIRSAESGRQDLATNLDPQLSAEAPDATSGSTETKH